MNPATYPQLVFSADGFTARPDIIAHVEARAISLHRRTHPRCGVVRVRISRESAHLGAAQYFATAIAGGATEECVAHGIANEPLPAIDESFRKLEVALKSV